MNTFLAGLVGVVIGSLSKSFLENLLPGSIKDYFNARRNLKFYFIRLFRESNKLHNDLIWHRNNVIRKKTSDQTPYYYLNLAYTFYRFQTVRKIIDETMEENFIRLPRRYQRFESLSSMINKSISSNYYFDFEELKFEYSHLNSISKIRYEKVIANMIIPTENKEKPEIMNIYNFEQLMKGKPELQDEMNRLLDFFKEMKEGSFSYQRLHLIITTLKVLNMNISINKPRKSLIGNTTRVPVNSNKIKRKLKEVLNQKTFEELDSDLEYQASIKNKIPVINQIYF